MSEISVSSQPLPNKKKKKTKPKKAENQGNILIEENRIKKDFKEICNPDGEITIDSLGHTMQKYKIDFTPKKLI